MRFLRFVGGAFFWLLVLSAMLLGTRHVFQRRWSPTSTTQIELSGLPALSPIACGTRCGVERWTVKTLTDADRERVRLSPRQTTVATLAGLPRPQFLPEDGRAPEERATYSVEAILVYWAYQDDGD